MEGRAVVGQLHYPSPPEPGTILGPNAWGELVVVLGTEEGTTYLGLATADEVAAARSQNRSLLEMRLP